MRPADVVRVLELVGFVRTRQKGSHVFLVHSERKLRTTVALHNRDMTRPMLLAVLKQAEVPLEEFVKLL